MADTDKLVEELSGLTVLEVADLVKALEDKWGVSAAAPAAVAVAGPAGDAGAAEEKTEFDVVLTSFGENKIAVIKEVRGNIDGLGLADAKKLVEAAPSTLKEAASKEEAEGLKAKFEAAGATIELK
ncbi:MAG: 50S ribosomal protein L7/L12 [Verrucomicrobiales bacterium]|nr:50S ribosomal protein L7/L12 [Verrucomicrobiales bacterium]